MTRPDDEFPPLDVTSTLNLGALDEVLEGPETDVVPSRMSGSLPPGMALLVVRRGPNAGARFLLDHDVTTSGRHPDSDIFLDDVTVSRRHAEFHRDGGTFTVRDVGSLNGTYVNRERVESATLSNGDEVQIGKFRLVFIAGPRPEGEGKRGVNPSGAAAHDHGSMAHSGRAPGGRDAALMSIGEVLAQLRTEFPDTTISKLRFLEAEGLVDPQRTASGYRKYSWNDVARLRFVLTAQRDQYLPLRVIREQLEAQERGDESPVHRRPSLVAVGSADEVPAVADTAESRVSRADLVERTGIAEQMLTELEQLGLVAARPPGWYDGDAVVIVEAVVGLVRHGLELRHLRAFRTGADREVALFAQLLTPQMRQHDPAARARAAETARELQALSQRLHAALVRAGLRDTLGR